MNNIRRLKWLIIFVKWCGYICRKKAVFSRSSWMNPTKLIYSILMVQCEFTNHRRRSSAYIRWRMRIAPPRTRRWRHHIRHFLFRCCTVHQVAAFDLRQAAKYVSGLNIDCLIIPAIISASFCFGLTPFPFHVPTFLMVRRGRSSLT